MATVYVFDNDHGTGHAALELDDGRYVSFGPLGASKLGPVLNSYPGRFSKSLSDDIESPDGYAPAPYRLTEHLTLPGLDETAMEEAFERMVGHTRYNLYQMNCSTVVAKLLMVGATEAIVGGHVSQQMWRLQTHAAHFFGRRHDRLHGRLTEHAIEISEGAAKAALQTMGAARSRQRVPILAFITAATVVADVVAREFIWKPGDVLELAGYIKEHLPATRRW